MKMSAIEIYDILVKAWPCEVLRGPSADRLLFEAARQSATKTMDEYWNEL
jgi:hypothetical protein